MRKQIETLKDDTDFLAQQPEINTSGIDTLSIDRDFSTLDRLKPIDAAEHRALARTRPTNDGNHLAARDIAFLREHFGSMADYLYRAARGIDLRPVRANRIRKSVGGERTFAHDISTGAALRETLGNIVGIVWDSIEKSGARGRTVTLKMKYTDFRIVTRSHSQGEPVGDREAFAAISRRLLEDLLPLPLPIRLMGLTLSNLEGDRAADPPPDFAQLSLL